ncbi:MAG: ABC transporter permease [Gammaproteobacteria bacterium]
MLARILAVTALNLRTLPARWGVAAVIVVCMAGVTGVMVSMLAMAEGFQRTYATSGHADRVVVISSSENFEGSSTITRDQAAALQGAPGLRRLADGAAAVSLERYAVSALKMRSGRDGNVVVRGVGPRVLEIRPEVQLIAGRMFEPGLRELIVGRGAADQFEGLAPGGTVVLSDVAWRVVGTFAAGGGALESEAWSDAEVVMAAFDLTSYSSMIGLLESAGSFELCRDTIAGDPRLQHIAQRETDYYANQTGILGRAMRAIGWLVASIMGLGALFAAVNTMYASIESRSVEIGTLRALGFQGLPVVASVMLESVALCLLGAVVGGAGAWLLFNGHVVSTVNGASFTQIAFAFAVTPALLAQGTALACLVGLLGGLPPALRAVRTPIVEALRAL